MIKSDAIKSLKTSMKENGYKTQGNYWYKESFDVIHFAAIQGSQWDTNDFYVNIGIMKKSHVTKKCHPDYEWDIWFRFQEKDMQPEPNNILHFILESHRKMSSVSTIDSLFRDGEIPQTYFRSYWDR